MRIAEIFRSIQGEGLLTGVESVFVRAGGCNLRCRWCDTPYASWTPEGEELSTPEILRRIDDLHTGPRPAFLGATDGRGFIKHVVLTGGEPMIFQEIVPLTETLRERGWHVTIETSGTRDLPVACDLMSISPKLSNSTPAVDGNKEWHRRHEQSRHAPEVIRGLIARYDYQMKFVVDSMDDCREVEEYLAGLPEIDRRRVMFMPQGVDAAGLAEKTAWLAPYCEAHGLVYCPRRQIEWFGAVRGR